MSLYAHFHPAIVHFPIALLLVGSVVALACLYQLVPAHWRMVAWFMLACGWVGGLAAILSGLVAQSRLLPDAPYALVINWHIGTGLAQLVLYGFLLYRGWIFHTARARHARTALGRSAQDLFDDRAARTWITFILCIGMLLIAATGWNGGILVYQWGVNVK